MATALSAQLQALAVGHGQASKRTRPSLLFKPVQAADIDVETILALAVSGLEELAEMDGQFESYRKTLFSPQSRQMDRELQTNEFNNKLNQSIGDYLRLLSSYIMLTPAQQTFEYLIRRYKVHVYNVDAVIICILPYHETNLFVQIVQFLQIEKTKWQFLKGVQVTGAPPPRTSLVQRCSHDLSLLNVICESAISVSRSAKSRKMVTFSTVLITETLGSVPTVTTELVNRILPYLLHSFEVGVHEEFQIGALMIMCALASKCSLSEVLLATLFESIARRIQREQDVDSSLLQLSVRVLIVLTQTQGMKQLPVKAFKFLVKMRDLPAVLVELGKKYETGKFVSMFLMSLVEHSVLHEHYELGFLQMIKLVPAGNQVGELVSRLVRLLFEQEDNDSAPSAEAGRIKARTVITRVLRAIEHQFPNEMGEAVESVMKEDSIAGKRTLVLEFLREVLEGTLHIPLAETNTSLLLSLEHPEARIRKAAVESVSTLVPQYIKGEEDFQMSGVLQEALLRRIGDDDYGVARAVLTVTDLAQFLPPPNLVEALRSLLSRCSKNSGREEKSITKTVVRLLACELVEQHPGYTEQVAFILLQYLLILPKTWKLNWTVLKLCQRLSFPLFINLSSIQDVPPEVDEVNAQMKKQNLRDNLSRTNHDLIGAMSSALLSDITLLLPKLAKAAREVKPARSLVMLILLHSLSSGKQGLQSVLGDYLSILRDEWAAAESEKGAAEFQFQKIDYKAWDEGVFPPQDFYDRLRSRPVPTYCELVLRSLYKLAMRALDDALPTSQAPNEKLSGVVADVFMTFAGSSSSEVFEPHLALLMEHLSVGVLRFLSRFVSADDSDVQTGVKVRSLHLLASQFSSVSGRSNLESEEAAALKSFSAKDVQAALPSLLVALANPLKAVRKGALACLKQMSTLVRDEGQSLTGVQGDRGMLPSKLFVKFLEAVMAHEKLFLANGNHLPSFFGHILGAVPNGSDELQTTSLDTSLNDADRKSIVVFLASRAQLLSSQSQRVMLPSLVGVVEHAVEFASATWNTLSQLLEKRSLGHLKGDSNPAAPRLSSEDIQLISMLLQAYTPQVATSGPFSDGSPRLAGVLQALTVEGGSSADPAVVQPCLSGIKCLTAEFHRVLDEGLQDHVLQTLVSLCAYANGDVRTAAREAVGRLNVSVHSLARHVEYLNGQLSKPNKGKRAKHRQGDCVQGGVAAGGADWPKEEMVASCACGLLEFIVGRPSHPDSYVLLEPLFNLLKQTVSPEWDSHVEAESATSLFTVTTYVEQLVLMALESITLSLCDDSVSEAAERVSAWYDVSLIVGCVSTATDGATRNHALALLTAAGKLYPHKVLNHVIDIVSVVGASVVSQDVSHSHEVVSEMLATIVPGWLESTQNPAQLFQVFVDALPQVPAHRRLALITNLFRVSKEEVGLPMFLWLLMLEVAKSGCDKEGRWQLRFAAELCEQYAACVQLRAFVGVLRMGGAAAAEEEEEEEEDGKALQKMTAEFVAERLQELQLVGAEKEWGVQDAYVGLLEQVLLQLQQFGGCSSGRRSRSRKGAQEAAYGLLDVVMGLMAPAAFSKSMTCLLKHPDTRIRRKVLRVFTAKMRRQQQWSKGGGDVGKRRGGRDEEVGLEFGDGELHSSMVTEMMRVVGEEDGRVSSTTHAAIVALDMYAQRYQGKEGLEMFVRCLPCLVSQLGSASSWVGSAALRCVASIFRVVGVGALSCLPGTMSELVRVGEGMKGGEDVGKCLSMLDAMEAVVEKLGLFLSPYLEDLVGMVVVQQEFVVEVGSRAKAVRELLADKIPARLLLEPVTRLYPKAVAAGEASTCALFQMVADMSRRLERSSSLAMYQRNIFSLCLTALDLRRQMPSSAWVSKVEGEVVAALVALVMKLGESSFRPLFIKCVEWAGEEEEEYRLHRSIAFYRLANELAEKLRSLFLPYLQYMVDGCVHQLSGDGGQHKHKHKKTKKKKKGLISPLEWHARVLVVSLLDKCFKYDSVCWLDAPRLQVLLKPLVVQLGVEAPSDGGEEMPSQKEMEERLVSCLGEMAVAAGTDVLWQQLNHEVLMQSRSEKVRTRVLCLEVMAGLVQRLREEYLVLLPETISFLAELLEDKELRVVRKAQEVVRMVEELSGEDLKQYL